MRRRITWIATLCCALLIVGIATSGPAGKGVPTAQTDRTSPVADPAAAQGATATPNSCDPSFQAASTALFNDPTGSRADQFRLLRHLVKLTDCTPPTNPDGSQATIKVTFYSLTYAPLRKALVAAARRGVSVQALTNSHADKYKAWRDLAKELGSDTTANSFATTCWRGCLTPRQPPVPGGPTAWFSASADSSDSSTVVFTDHSRAGAEPVTSWSWDFGDGTQATGPGPHSKTYDASRVYSTLLTVRDAAGVTHRMRGDVTVPDSEEPVAPSLHSKVFLFSTVGTGRTAHRWVSAYSSGNPTTLQALRAFNNLNVFVGDAELFGVLERYVADLVAGSKGTLLASDYYRSARTAGSPSTGSPATIVHFLPSASADVQLDILRSIRCRYKVDGTTRRTKVRISMFQVSRIEIGAELWRLAFERGCSVDIVYTSMSQRLSGAGRGWDRHGIGVIMGTGPADCLSTPPTKVVEVTTRAGRTRRTQVPNTVDDPAGLCSGGTLRGRVAGTKAGVWVDRVSPTTKGRLTVTAGCPVSPHFDPMLRMWSFRCKGAKLTHHKLMLVDGMIHGKVQKYVLTGSGNWSASGLRRNDEVVTELLDAPGIYRQYLKAFEHERVALVRSSRDEAED